jgi:hypothetical protein
MMRLYFFFFESSYSSYLAITVEPLEERKKPKSCPHSISNLERVIPLQLDRALSIQMPAIPGATTLVNYRKVYYKRYSFYCKENRLHMLQTQIVKTFGN